MRSYESKSCIVQIVPLLALGLLVGVSAFAADASSGEKDYSAKGQMVPMRDGTQLQADLYVPKGAGPYPAVLLRTVYNKSAGQSFSIFFNALEIALVVQDTRGRGGSEGKDMVFADDGWGERQDGADTVKWIAEQPWCNGKIGTFGMSALGITQILMAPVTPELTCQGIWVAASNFYGQLSYQGGVFRKMLCEKWLKGQGSLHALDIWRAHPQYDTYWEGYNADAQAPRVSTPAIHIGGWWDIFGQGTINSFVTRQQQGAEGAKGKQMLIMGAWCHGGPVPNRKVGEFTMPKNFAFDLNGVSGRFLDHWLTGADNGIVNEPAVRYYSVGDMDDADAPGNEWREAEDWPPFPTTETPLYLTPAKELSKEIPEDDNLDYTFDPTDPCPTQGGPNLFGDHGIGPMDQQSLAERADVLRFATEPLDAPIEITGRVRAKLYVSSDAPDTDFAVKLLDIYPDGKEMLMLDGIQRLKFRDSFEKADPLTPGEIGAVEVDLWSISLVVNKGHRIGIHVTSSNYPRFEVNPNTGADFPPAEGAEGFRTTKNTIHLGKAHPSAILLPVRP